MCSQEQLFTFRHFFLSDYESLKLGSEEKLLFLNTFFRLDSRRVSQERTFNLDRVQNALVFTKEVSVLLSLVPPVETEKHLFVQKCFIECITDIT